MGSHKGEDTKGRLKEASATSRETRACQREGKIDQASAATKETIDKAADAVTDVVDPKK